MKLRNSEIKNILVISLSNIGDVILTFPVIDVLKRDFPSAKLSVVVGPKAESLFEENPNIAKTYVFNKHSSLKKKMFWTFNLRKHHFDLAVDLRNTAIPLFSGAKYRTPLHARKQSGVHMKDKHLMRLGSVYDFNSESKTKYALHINTSAHRYIYQKLQDVLGDEKRIVVVSPGAANHTKQWKIDGFAQVSDKLIEKNKVKVVFVGDKNDKTVVGEVIRNMRQKAIDMSGQTNLIELAELIRRSILVIANDSAVMHMSSYVDVPTVAIFGPSDPKKYGPWSSISKAIQKDIFCVPCKKSGCAYKHECMQNITEKDVLDAAEDILIKTNTGKEG